MSSYPLLAGRMLRMRHRRYVAPLVTLVVTGLTALGAGGALLLDPDGFAAGTATEIAIRLTTQSIIGLAGVNGK